MPAYSYSIIGVTGNTEKKYIHTEDIVIRLEIFESQYNNKIDST